MAVLKDEVLNKARVEVAARIGLSHFTRVHVVCHVVQRLPAERGVGRISMQHGTTRDPLLRQHPRFDWSVGQPVEAQSQHEQSGCAHVEQTSRAPDSDLAPPRALQTPTQGSIERGRLAFGRANRFRHSAASTA
ncbi:unnamed protein product [Protopolystoma xenopodis]|uniref:Uncharacterized protein n=1 Tax=Protopolystoma xenopodis TaxID=117903 RepID=A0A3S5AER2_9PLAT|nr:unnamed protein product [Protopolystoma xenopodis]